MYKKSFSPIWTAMERGFKAKKLNTEIQKGEVLTLGDLCSALVLVGVLPVPSIMLEMFPLPLAPCIRRPLIGGIPWCHLHRPLSVLGAAIILKSSLRWQAQLLALQHLGVNILEMVNINVKWQSWRMSNAKQVAPASRLSSIPTLYLHNTGPNSWLLLAFFLIAKHSSIIDLGWANALG